MATKKPPAQDPVPMAETRLTMERLMLPTDANVYGNVHGGMIIKYIDEAAGIVAHRHARSNIVTASIDRMNFFEPVFIGNVLILKAALNYTGTTSMEIGVRVEAEEMDTGVVTRTGSCHLVYVALGKNGKPVPVKPVEPGNAEERRWYEHAKKRREGRLRAKAKA